MRKRLIKTARTVVAKPWPIITFDNKDFSQQLLGNYKSKAISANSEVAGKHADILRLSAAQANSVCLASNQINDQHQIIAVQKQIVPGVGNCMKWISESYDNPQNYCVYHQPEIVAADSLIEQTEQSISFPFFLFTVKRYNRIVFQHKKLNGARAHEQMRGYSAWAFQHSLEQLKGTVPLDWRVNHGKISFSEEVAVYFPKTVSIIEQYSSDLCKIFSEYPQLISKVQSFTQRSKALNSMQDEQLPFQSDYSLRLMKHYSREMEMLYERIKEGSLNDVVWEQKQISVKLIKK